jgi:pyruvate/2-oxoglutarate dehydrogenase complex dihydrolipoamide acyltransferase (E2) component
VVTLAPQGITMTTELPGRTSPNRVAEVRPQVGGLILQRFFTEGSEVTAGQPLYQIDPATYQAAYESARASQARAEATLGNAKLLFDRRRSLAANGWVSRQDYESAVASAQQAEADLGSACPRDLFRPAVLRRHPPAVPGEAGAGRRENSGHRGSSRARRVNAWSATLWIALVFSSSARASPG